MDKSFYNLLAQINGINKKYEHILKVTGEDFNIFKVLKLQRAENRLHSAFLAELLNPKGSHGQKDIFLKLFIKRLIGHETSFDTVNAKIDVEKHVGFISEDKKNGGRIDICINDKKGNEILIENKIYAADQENQLIRYSNYNKDATLFYLCLDGRKASKISCGDLKEAEHFHVISYSKDLVPWLEDCRKESVAHPLLRESITQYINLIKYLTGQTINNDMNKEVISAIIENKDALAASFVIANTVDAACDELLKKFHVIVREIGEELELEVEFNINWKKKYSAIYFYKNDWKNSSIGFEFQQYDREFVYGVVREEECRDLPDPYTVQIFDRLKGLGGTISPWWFFYKPVEEPLDNWNNVEPWQAIIDGSIKGIIKGKIEEILFLLGDFKL